MILTALYALLFLGFGALIALIVWKNLVVITDLSPRLRMCTATFCMIYFELPRTKTAGQQIRLASVCRDKTADGSEMTNSPKQVLAWQYHAWRFW